MSASIKAVNAYFNEKLTANDRQNLARGRAAAWCSANRSADTRVHAVGVDEAADGTTKCLPTPRNPIALSSAYRPRSARSACLARLGLPSAALAAMSPMRKSRA
ncbi:hypothetical protein [Roseovarius sp. SYSU LYC5161]|uniref:hypothetical protein n=1 Tax=Roseovarius halophilus (ex Wu et al. 2025) TaxID=3376060 RepID=UPI003999570C